MADRGSVAIAEYLYRHEAEFAAGFLRDAGIPYRLQVDDAGGIDAGVTFTRPARIWVRREDATKARDLLEVTPDAAIPHDPDDEPATGFFVPGGESEEVLPAAGHAGERLPGRPGEGAELCGAERVVGLTLGAAFTALGMGFGGVAPPGTAGTIWMLGMGLIGAVLFVSGLVGRAWGPVRSLLRALAGVAP